MNQEQQQIIDDQIIMLAESVQEQLKKLQVEQVIQSGYQAWNLTPEQKEGLIFETYSLLIGIRESEKFAAALVLNYDFNNEILGKVSVVLEQKIINPFFDWLDQYLKENPDGLFAKEIINKNSIPEVSADGLKVGDSGQNQIHNDLAPTTTNKDETKEATKELQSPIVEPQIGTEAKVAIATPNNVEIQPQNNPEISPKMNLEIAPKINPIIAPSPKPEITSPVVETQLANPAKSVTATFKPPIAKPVTESSNSFNSPQSVRANIPNFTDLPKKDLVEHKLTFQTNVPPAAVDLMANNKQNNSAQTTVPNKNLFTKSANSQYKTPTPQPDLSKYTGGNDPYREPIE